MAMASRGFYLACLLLGALGFLCILGTTYWAQHWRGGFAWDGGKHMFNWHPVLMVSGMVVLYGAASLVYRLPQAWLGPRLPWKALHAALHLGAFVLAVVGLVAVFRYHSHAGITHLYSLHSWLGLTTTVLFSCQWFLGFTIFLLPWASLWLRSLLKPLHVFFGAAILSLSMASVISGINEKLFFSLPCCVTGNDVRRSSQKSPLCPAPLRSTVHLRLPGVGVSLPWGWPSLQPAAVSTSLGIGRDFSGLHLCRSLLPWPLLLAAYCSPCRSGDPQEVSLGSGRVQPVWKPGRGCSPGAVTQLLALRVASRHCV
ncbi:cytochrome b ascorbate-dependent protein 3 isoform X1 [Heterocephalus glaber]|uniref:Lysosomal membrane ascorbate-dependent ferrireductase CYB561A3 n=1 Tax=Heterocephalus glaber TaxID=10181 RepID=A0AAX6SDE8_HETGA|nr:cytochrome b ascorbate-dependent protein 3 isoform X1 [Heterocephalus glaber]XP_004874395.1 cytochrome b ascorbate-dependent protein 3 isoform X1 [Heterocephalus glaber]XP_004874396.1 cytochrome b ascorbate-dependent protein 3 isoform X1 [Heterocephalus glaber]XP_021107440.1 cytochrome b ascorbate-dependent protein 3 isoform X1 [Heterocephalus glaber]XP_021107441.1 cytochrome b ascorbate-dependent protein 3 isoform X1 [Heterocephalus glaber]